MSQARSGIIALALSFAVYLVPLPGEHAIFSIGEVVWRDISAGFYGGAKIDPAWAAADTGIAILAQLIVFFLVFWFLLRPNWRRGLLLGLSIVSAVVALNDVYLFVLPAHFLIEADSAPERDSWPVQCVARGVWIPQILAPPSVSATARLWVANNEAPSRYGLIDPATCAVKWLALEYSGFGYLTYAADGRALYLRTAPSSDRRNWSIVEASSGAETPILIDPDAAQFPILSVQGDSVAWLRPIAGTQPPVQLEAVIESAASGSERRVLDLSALGRGGLVQLLQLDSRGQEIIAARGLSELFWIGFDGRTRRHLPKPNALDPQPQTFRLLDTGWAAWDAYRDEEPYRIAWRLSTGDGNFRVPKGRSITSLALSPDGRWIAASVTSGISIGSTPDAVFVERAADASEVFRTYLPKYARSTVAFPDSGRFVYSDTEGVRVLSIR